MKLCFRLVVWEVLLFCCVVSSIAKESRSSVENNRVVVDMGPIPPPEFEEIVSWYGNKPLQSFIEVDVDSRKMRKLFSEQPSRIIGMFEHAFSGYRKYASGFDELNGYSCTGSNDLGGFSVSLIEGLSTLLLLDPSQSNVEKLLQDTLLDFIHLIENPNEYLEKDVEISVFETTIRILGPLLSIHEIANGNIPSYHINPLLNDEDLDTILNICIKLGDKLLDAYDSRSDIPYPTINLKRGITKRDEESDILISAAGTSLLEFGMLSHLSKNGKYKGAAESTAMILYHKRNLETELLGTRLSVNTGEWLDPRSSIGGNADSYLEYMSKYPQFIKNISPKPSSRWHTRFNRLLNALRNNAKFPPYWIDVHMDTGKVIYPYAYALGAFWPSLLAYEGHIEEAEENFEAVMSLWQVYGGLPEVQNVMHMDAVPLKGMQQYFLRPEAAESAFYLYQKTKNKKYQYAGYLMLEAIERTMKTDCGYTILESVVTKQKGDKMPSYFLSETLKYLYLLFEESHPLLQDNLFDKFIFSTEGQVFPIPQNPFQFHIHEEL